MAQLQRYALEKSAKRILLLALLLGSLLNVAAKPPAKISQPSAVLIAKWKSAKFVSNLTFSPIAQRLIWIGYEESKEPHRKRMGH